MRSLSLSDPVFLKKLSQPPVPAPLPSDYWHESDANYTSSPYAPQQSYIGTGGASYALSTNQVVLMPFFVGRRGRTVAEMGLLLTAAPALPAGAKLGIYDCSPASARDIYPKNLVASVTVVFTNTTGRQVASLVSPVTLPNGLYWIAVGRNSANAVNCRSINSTGFALTAERNPLQWSSTSPTLGNNRLVLSLANASPLPASIPTFDGVTVTLATSANPQVEIA
jgi:hypothetical protein